MTPFETSNFHHYNQNNNYTCPKCLCLVPMVDPFKDEQDPRSPLEKHIEWHKWLHEMYKNG
jgi:hypothetical protein